MSQDSAPGHGLELPLTWNLYQIFWCVFASFLVHLWFEGLIFPFSKSLFISLGHTRHTSCSQSLAFWRT
jgi:hypothetical protein